MWVELRKEHARGGIRKEIVQSDDEEDAKKVSKEQIELQELSSQF